MGTDCTHADALGALEQEIAAGTYKIGGWQRWLSRVERDPDFSGDRGQALRVLLYLFERDAAVAYLRSG